MSSLIYSPYKIAHHQNELEQLKKKEQPIPLQVQLIVSDFCNHNCQFCAYRLEGYTSNQNFGVWDSTKNTKNNNPKRIIPYQKCIEILDDCKKLGVKAMQFTGGGEPTMHPKLEDILQACLNRDLELALVTNGYKVSDKLIELIIRGTWLRVSLDAATAKKYSHVRKVSENAFYRTLNNITKIVDAKNQNASKLIFGISFVVNKHNHEEIYDAAKLCSELGVDNIRFSAAFTENEFDYHKKHYESSKELILKAIEDFNKPNFRVFNTFGERIQDLKQRKPNYEFCGYMHLNTYIGGDLKVYTCCTNAYSNHGEMGDLSNQTFYDYWKSLKKERKFKAFRASSCKRCMFNTKNQFINYLIEENPPHVNYM